MEYEPPTARKILLFRPQTHSQAVREWHDKLVQKWTHSP